MINSERLLLWLGAMMFLSLVPAVPHSKVMETLVWMRVPGDIVFGCGAILLALFLARLLLLRRRIAERTYPTPELVPAE